MKYHRLVAGDDEDDRDPTVIDPPGVVTARRNIAEYIRGYEDARRAEWMNGFTVGKHAGYVDVLRALLPLLWQLGWTMDRLVEYLSTQPLDRPLAEAIALRHLTGDQTVG